MIEINNKVSEISLIITPRKDRINIGYRIEKSQYIFALPILSLNALIRL